MGLCEPLRCDGCWDLGFGDVGALFAFKGGFGRVCSVECRFFFGGCGGSAACRGGCVDGAFGSLFVAGSFRSGDQIERDLSESGRGMFELWSEFSCSIREASGLLHSTQVCDVVAWSATILRCRCFFHSATNFGRARGCWRHERLSSFRVEQGLHGVSSPPPLPLAAAAFLSSVSLADLCPRNGHVGNWLVQAQLRGTCRPIASLFFERIFSACLLDGCTDAGRWFVGDILGVSLALN